MKPGNSQPETQNADVQPKAAPKYEAPRITSKKKLERVTLGGSSGCVTSGGIPKKCP